MVTPERDFTDVVGVSWDRRHTLNVDIVGVPAAFEFTLLDIEGGIVYRSLTCRPIFTDEGLEIDVASTVGLAACGTPIENHAEEVLERGGWRVVHDIVDSIWVQATENEEQTPLDALAERISERARVRLEYEAEYDWVAFVPLRDSEAGALRKYFGRKADPPEGESTYKYRGIECRQRSTPVFVEEVQKALIDAFDDHRNPEAVCDVLATELARLERGEVPASELRIKNRVSKRVEEYTQSTRNVAYVVVDDAKASRDRVRLASEDVREGEYDAEFYRDLTVCAAESVLAPLGWRRSEIKQYLSDRHDATLSVF